MEKIITDNIEAIHRLCRKYHVKTLYVFGSAAGSSIDSHSFGSTSDIDLLVEYESHVYDANSPISGFDFLHLIEELEEIFGRKVDLISLRSLRNPVLIRNINRQKQLIYGRTG